MNGTVVGAVMANHDKTFAGTFRDDEAVASQGNSDALSCLVAEIDAHPLPRKALAGECDKTEQTFSKMASGVQAFGIEDFGRLPRDLQVKWMQRYGREVLGVSVRELDPAELNEELLSLVDRMVSVRRLTTRIGKLKPAQAQMAAKEKRAVNG